VHDCLPKRLLVLGATGRVGRLVVAEALKRRYEVSALVRTPEKLDHVADNVRVVRGDALDPSAVAAAVTNQDAVLYVLGAGNVRRTSLFSDSTRLLLDQMQRQGGRRLISVTGVGAGETRGHGGFLYDRILYPLFTKGIYADKDRQEALIRQSATDWTIVRPAPFCRRTPPGPLRIETRVRDLVLRKISPQEVATFMVDELEQGRFIRQAVFIGHE
jgi:putative NADH-flavin reductase